MSISTLSFILANNRDFVEQFARHLWKAVMIQPWLSDVRMFLWDYTLYGSETGGKLLPLSLCYAFSCGVILHIFYDTFMIE